MRSLLKNLFWVPISQTASEVILAEVLIHIDLVRGNFFGRGFPRFSC